MGFLLPASARHLTLSGAVTGRQVLQAEKKTHMNLRIVSTCRPVAGSASIMSLSISVSDSLTLCYWPSGESPVTVAVCN